MTISASFSVRDVVSNTYGQPFFSQSKGTASRSVGMEVNNPNMSSVLHTNPDDFELYLIGYFDDETAAFTPVTPPELVLRLSSLVKEADPISVS